MIIEILFQPDMFLQVQGFTPGRVAALLPALLGVASIIIGRRALARSRRTGSTQLGSMAALLLGLAAVVIAGLHLGRANGAIGTGSGKLGAIIALVLGTIGVVLAGLALRRLRRSHRGSMVNSRGMS
jgi:hypothetical protein